MTDLAPVVLFVYNRPWHTEQTLNALMQNELAGESVLYIYSDGAKNDATDEQKFKINELRKVIRKEKWCKEVHIIESKKNKGLANSIVDGVTEIIEKHGKVIVLEDDLVTSKYFLKYMNSSLDFYFKYKSVFSVSADRPPISLFHIPKDYNYDVFVSFRFFSTGWGTWKDRWNQVNWNQDYLSEFLNKTEQIKAFNRGGEDLTQMLTLQRDRKIDSWAISFVFAHFKNHAVAILPCISYIKNIGFDGSGIHSGIVESNYSNEISLAKSQPLFLDILYEDSRIINSFYSFYYPKKRPIWKKIINRFGRLIFGKNFIFVKKKVYN